MAKDHLSSVAVFYLLIHKGIFTNMYNLWEVLFSLKILIVTENFPLLIFMKESKALEFESGLLVSYNSCCLDV